MQNLQILLNSLPGVAAQGLIWGIMAIGLYITYKILDVADLTVDGSFCTGGMTCAVLLTVGCNVWVAMLGALIAGMAAGFVTGVLHTKLKIPAILSGILTQLGLWSVNLAISSIVDGNFASSRSLNQLVDKNVLVVSMRYMEEISVGKRPFFQHPVLVAAVFTAAVILLLYWFFGTELGCSIRATGANGKMARAQGINTDTRKLLGLTLSNGLVALSGALLAQYNANAEINMGRGAIVIGLAAIIIGSVAFGKVFHNFGLKLLAVSLGAIIYYLVIQIVITMLNIDSNYLKLITAVIVALFLSVPNLKVGKLFKKQGKEATHA